MNATDAVDAGRLALALNDLRLPTIKAIWPEFAARADKEGWPAARFLAALAEHEMAERASRRIQRHLDEARLPPGKTFDNFDFTAVPMVSKAQVMALAAGDSWLDKGANLLMFGPPGGGSLTWPPLSVGPSSKKAGGCSTRARPTSCRSCRRHAGTATRSRPRQARQIPSPDPRRPGLRHQGSGRDQRALRAHQRPLRAALHADHSQPALRRMGQDLPDPAMTLAAVDRLVHHATIFEMNVESYRRRAAIARKRTSEGGE